MTCVFFSSFFSLFFRDWKAVRRASLTGITQKMKDSLAWKWRAMIKVRDTHKTKNMMRERETERQRERQRE